MKRRHLLFSVFMALCAVFLTGPIMAQFPVITCELQCHNGVDTLPPCQNGLAYVYVPTSNCSQAMYAQTSTGFRDTLDLTQTVLRIPLPAGFTGPFTVTWMQKATAFTLGDTCTSSYFIPNTPPKPATFNLTDCGKVEVVKADSSCGLTFKLTMPGSESCCTALEWGKAAVYNVLDTTKSVWTRMFSDNNPILFVKDSLAAGDYMVVYTLQDDHLVVRRCTTYATTIPPSGELVQECREPELYLDGCFWRVNIPNANPIGNCATLAATNVHIHGLTDPNVNYTAEGIFDSVTYPNHSLFHADLLPGRSYEITTSYFKYDSIGNPKWSYDCIDTIAIPNHSLTVDCSTAKITPKGNCGEGRIFDFPDADDCASDKTGVEWTTIKVFRDDVTDEVFTGMSTPGVHQDTFHWDGPIDTGWYTAKFILRPWKHDPLSNVEPTDVICMKRFYVPAGIANTAPSIDCVPIIGGTVTCGGTIHVAIPPATSSTPPCAQASSWTTTIVSNGQTVYTGPTNGVPSGITLSAGSYTVYYSATNSAGSDACAWTFTITSTTTPPVVTCPVITPGTTNCGATMTKIIPAATASTGNCGNQQISWTTTITNGNGTVAFNGPTNGVPAGMQFSAGTYTVTYTATNAVGSGTCTTSFIITNINTPNLILNCDAEPTYVEAGNCTFNVVVAQALQTAFCGIVEWGKVTINGVTWMFNGQPSVTFFGLNAGTTYTAEFTYIMYGDSTTYKCWKTFTTPPATPYMQLFCANVVTTFAGDPNCTQTVTATLPIVAEYCGAKVQPGSGKARLHTGQLVNIANNTVSFAGLQPGTLYTLEFSYQMIGDTTPFTCTRNFVTPPATATISMDCNKVIITSTLSANCTWTVTATEPDPTVSCGTITLRKASLNGTNKPIVNGLVTLDQLAGSTQYTLVYTYQISGSTLTYNCTKTFTTDPLPAPQIFCSQPTVYSTDSCGSGLSIPLPILTSCVPIIGVEVDVYNTGGDLVKHGSFASLAAGALFQTGTLPAGTYTVTTTVLYAGGDINCTSAPVSVTGGVPRVEIDCSDVVRNINCDGSFDLFAATATGYCGAQLVPEWILNSFVDSNGNQVWMFKFMPNQPQVLHVTPDSLPAGTYTLNVLYYTVNGLSDSCSITVVIPEADPCCGNSIAPLLECKPLPDSIDICDPLYNIGDSLEIVLNPKLYKFSDDCTDSVDLVWMAMIFKPGLGFIASATNEPLVTSLPIGTYVITVVVRDPQYNWSVACQQMITVYCSDDTPKPIDSIQTVMRIFPNPVSDRVTIAMDGEADSYDVKILDLAGRLIKEMTITDSGTLDVSSLPIGTYIAKSIGTTPKLFVIQR